MIDSFYLMWISIIWLNCAKTTSIDYSRATMTGTLLFQLSFTKVKKPNMTTPRLRTIKVA